MLCTVRCRLVSY